MPLLAAFLFLHLWHSPRPGAGALSLYTFLKVLAMGYSSQQCVQMTYRHEITQLSAPVFYCSDVSGGETAQGCTGCLPPSPSANAHLSPPGPVQVPELRSGSR